MSLSDRLRSSRKKNNLSQLALADLAKINRVTITQLEGNKIKSIDGKNLLRLCSVLSVSPEWLVTGKGSMMPGTEGSRLSPDANDLANKYMSLSDSQKAVIRAMMDEMSPPK